jgi:hypothetical protein
LGVRNLHFLNWFEQNKRFKGAPNGRVQKIQHCKGQVKRKQLQEERTKLAHITGVSTYLPYFFILLAIKVYSFSFFLS